MSAAEDGPFDPSALLRAATRVRHEALERSDWLADALRDLHSYAAHLTRLTALHVAAEDALRPHRAELDGYGFASSSRRKTPLLRHELSALAREVCIPPALVAAFPVLSTLADAVGALYVLEGASLGGVIIARAVREQLGWASVFYAGYGTATATRWREFGAAARAAAPALDETQLVATACATFDAYGVAVAAA